MKIRVRFFARYREALGVDELAVEGQFATLDELRRWLLQRNGAEVLGERNVLCARNEELCSLDEALADGDEVAFFPTVTGG